MVSGKVIKSVIFRCISGLDYIFQSLMYAKFAEKHHHLTSLTKRVNTIVILRIGIGYVGDAIWS